MRITKDESRILAVLLDISKYTFLEEREQAYPNLIEKLSKLQEKLYTGGHDTRRTSLNDFDDVLKRFTETK